MANSSNLEVQFLIAEKRIERYAAFGDDERTMQLVKKAMPLCEKIHDGTSDPQKKQVMRDNALKLKNIYETCRARSGGENELTIGQPERREPKCVPASKPKNADKSAGAPEPKEKENGESESIINGVNVEEFLVKDSNETVTFADVVGMDEEKKLIEREFFLTDEERAFNEFLGKSRKLSFSYTACRERAKLFLPKRFRRS